MDREWSASQAAHRIRRGWVNQTYAQRRGVSSDGLESCREVLQGCGKGGLLPGGERREPEAAAGHEVGLAPELALPPDHGAPDHLGREAQRPARRREIERAGSTEAEEVEVLDLRARRAEIEEADLPRLDRRPRAVVDIEGVVELMGALVRVRASEHGIAVPLLATRSDLEHLAAGEDEESPLLQGWRKALIGDDLQRLLDGKLTLRVHDGAVVPEERD